MLFSFVVRAQAPADYLNWLENLKREMIEKGVNAELVEKVYEQNYYHSMPEVVKQDKKQAEFVLSTNQYLQKMITANRVLQGQKAYQKHQKLLQKIEDKYGVKGEYLIAFWAVESNFGNHFGNFMLVESLTNLSYDPRRSDFFRKELFYTLKIIEEQKLDYKNLRGSWAGAMGHFQFMPSTFMAYGVDFNEDGHIDIINSFEDASASAANYLSKLKWKKDEPWGQKVDLSWNFDYSQASRDSIKTVAEWKKLGVNTTLDENFKGAIIVPEGYKGQAYIVLGNFMKMMIWNRSENYALAVAMLAEQIKNSDAKYESALIREPIKTEDIIKIQEFINHHKIDIVEVDGQLGRGTRAAIKKLQKKFHLPQDGYPSYLLNLKIKRFDNQKGFALGSPV